MTYESMVQFWSERKNVGDTVFSYPGNEDCWIGATSQIFYDSNLRPLSRGETFYWAGCGCDLPRGTDFLSARELFEAPIYGGKSIRDRWDEITWHEIDGWMSEEEFDRRLGEGFVNRKYNLEFAMGRRGGKVSMV